jgi:hypothetical protein
VRKTAWIAVTAVSLSAISVSYAKGLTPESANGLAPLDPGLSASSQPSASSKPNDSAQPSASAAASASSAPQPSASASTSAGGSGTKPAPKPSKPSGSGGTSSSAPKPSTAPKPPPAPVVKTVNSDVINYVTNNLQKNLQVSVTFSDATITAIQILQGDTNNGIGKAYPVLIQAAISAQGSNFGNYTGATYTTNAFKTAVNNAIAKR